MVKVLPIWTDRPVGAVKTMLERRPMVIAICAFRVAPPVEVNGMVKLAEPAMLPALTA